MTTTSPNSSLTTTQCAVDLARAVQLETEGLVDRAAEAFWRAAERARRLYANAEAADYFRRALTLLEEVRDPDPEWFTELTGTLREGLGDVLVLAGEPEQARRCSHGPKSSCREATAFAGPGCCASRDTASACSKTGRRKRPQP